MGYVEVDEHLDFRPSVYGFHGAVVRRRPGPGHRMRDMILGKELVEALRSVDGALIGVQDRIEPVYFLYLLGRHLQALEVGVPIALPAREAVADDLVVPEVRVERELTVPPSLPEGGHVADDALERAVDAEGGHDGVGVDLLRLPGLFVGVVPALRLYAGESAASVGALVGHHEAQVEFYLRVQPPVSVARVFGVVLLEQRDVGHPFPEPVRGAGEPSLPFVVPGPRYRHGPAEGFDRPPSRELHRYLELALFIETNSLPLPPPSTAYPFFARATSMSLSISSLMSSSLVIDL